MGQYLSCVRISFIYLIGALVICYLLLEKVSFIKSTLYFNRINEQSHCQLTNDVKYNRTKQNNISLILFQSNRDHLPKNLYITSWPDHGAGIGHQVGEWLQGLWAAYVFNITYVYTPFLIHSDQWNSFLGFGHNELVENDLKIHFDPLNVLELRKDTNNSMSTKDWILEQRRKHINQYSQNNTVLLRLYRISNLVSDRNAICFVPIMTTLRMKYCFARFIQPVEKNLYEDDINHNRFVVAIHIRCGDSCYDIYRTTPMISIENSILTIHETISEYYPNRQVVIHIFSQSPKNNTAEEQFRLLLHNDKFQRAKPFPIIIKSHFSLNAPMTLHHLITADMLLTAQSGFSVVASIFRLGITFGPIQSCDSNLTINSYDKKTGNFSIKELRSALQYSQSMQDRQNQRVKYHPKTLEDCHTYENNL